MSKYIKLEDAIYSDCILIDEIMCEGCPFFDGERFLCRMMAWLESLPTYEVSEKVEDERCKGCKHYKLACDLFSEICKYEPITQTETQNSNLTFEIADTPKAKVSEDCIGREYLEEEYWQTLIPKEMINTDVELGINIGIDKMHDVIKNAPSVVPTVRKTRTTAEPQTYITEDRDTQILDAWQVHHRNIMTVEDEPTTEQSSVVGEWKP